MDAKQTVSKSFVVKAFLSTGLCDSFFKASLDWDVQEVNFETTKESAFSSTELKTADQEVFQEEWSILVDDDNETSGALLSSYS